MVDSASVPEPILNQAQQCAASRPVIVLGSGASSAFGLPGMTALASHLIANIPTCDLSGADREIWSRFVSLLKGKLDLESALHQVQLGEDLTRRVVEQSWFLFNPTDLAVYKRSLQNRELFPLSAFVRFLFDSTHKQLDIVTTNYDRLAEYAVENAGFLHYTGFTYGYTRRMESPQGFGTQRVVNVWKVHGSLDWYKSQDGEIIALANSAEANPFLCPVIVTPGIEKYRRTHLEPFRSIIQGADHALSHARAYLAVGYGFNDLHIQEKLVNRCKKDGALVVVLARKLTTSAKNFLFSGKCPSYLAIEQDGNGTYMDPPPTSTDLRSFFFIFCCHSG